MTLAFGHSGILSSLQTSCLSSVAIGGRFDVPSSSLGPSFSVLGVQALAPLAEAQRISGSSPSGRRHYPSSYVEPVFSSGSHEVKRGKY